MPGALGHLLDRRRAWCPEGSAHEFGGVRISPSMTTCTADDGRFRQLAVTQQDRLARVRVDGELAQQHVRQQRDGLDVAARPARVVRRDAARRRSRSPRRCAVGNGAAECKHGARNVGQRRVIAAVLGAARHLPVDVLIARRRCGAMSFAMISRHSSRVCGSSMRISPRLRVMRSRCASKRNGRPRVHRHHFVHAVRIQEAAIERRDARLFERHVLAVQIAERVAASAIAVHQNQSFTLSTMRVHSPPSATAFSGYSGTFATTSPVCVGDGELADRLVRRQRRDQRLVDGRRVVFRVAASPRPTVTHDVLRHADRRDSPRRTCRRAASGSRRRAIFTFAVS